MVHGDAGSGVGSKEGDNFEDWGDDRTALIARKALCLCTDWARELWSLSKPLRKQLEVVGLVANIFDAQESVQSEPSSKSSSVTVRFWHLWPFLVCFF
jgi:hypothetical protein